MRVSTVALFVAALTCGSSAAYARPENWKQLTKDFCTAQQAMAVCDGLIMRMDTEDRFNAKHGFQVRNREDDESRTICLNAIAAFKPGPASCAKALQDYGCQGQKHPKLLMESRRTGTTCPY